MIQQYLSLLSQGNSQERNMGAVFTDLDLKEPVGSGAVILLIK